MFVVGLGKLYMIIAYIVLAYLFIYVTYVQHKINKKTENVLHDLESNITSDLLDLREHIGTLHKNMLGVQQQLGTHDANILFNDINKIKHKLSNITPQVNANTSNIDNLRKRIDNLLPQIRQISQNVEKIHSTVN